MKKKREYTRNKKRALGLSVLLTVILVMSLIVMSLNYTLKKNVYSRVTDESEFLAKQQSELINKAIEEQFHKLSTISSMVEAGLSFYDEKDRVILNAVVEQNELCMLAYADKNGNVITYQGEEIGSIADREYFTQIISGKKEYTCQYLARTKAGNAPRVIFSTALYQQGIIQGVVFFSKEISVLKDNLFQQSMFYNNDSSLIIDTSGNILVKNNAAQKEYATSESIYDIYSKAENTNLALNKQSGSMLLGEDKEMVLAYSSIKYNGWYLICLIDTDIARQEYAESLTTIRQLVLILSVCFWGGGIYVFALLAFHIKNTHKKLKENKERYDRIIILLKKMQCMILEYDIDNEQIITNDLFKNAFGYGIRNDFFEKIEEHKKVHPEFDFDGLIRELNYTIKNKQTSSFESLYCKSDYSYKMLSIIMMPIINGYGEVIKIIGSIRENSAEHTQLKEKVDMFDQIPGGTHRCYLSDPVHLDYIGEKLCKMLGYTLNEFKEAIGDYYINLIVEEDKDKFRNFIKESAASPGVRKCQYCVRCKNGQFLQVLDTMESIKNDSGTMYGYSVVVDISEYVKRQKIAQQEIKQLEKNLEAMRIQNSASQMQPHFLYNSLSSIREMVLKDPKYASDLIYDFTIYLRACIRTMQKDDLIPIQQEMNNIVAYVNIEKMRMGSRLKIVYNLKAEEFLIVPLSIQPFVENAIRHGIYNRGRDGGTVTIETQTLQTYNLIIVKDNGIGFDYQKVRDEVESGKRDSIGLDNVMFRLKVQLNASVAIKSQLGVGTVITIRIPKEGNNNESDYTR